jgi:hypothetical protein
MPAYPAVVSLSAECVCDLEFEFLFHAFTINQPPLLSTNILSRAKVFFSKLITDIVWLLFSPLYVICTEARDARPRILRESRLLWFLDLGTITSYHIPNNKATKTFCDFFLRRGKSFPSPAACQTRDVFYSTCHSSYSLIITV